MKVKIEYNYWLQDVNDDDGCTSNPCIFNKGEIYDVVYQFENETYGLSDHTVFVIINKNGESMSLSKEVCKIVEESEDK